MAFPPFDEIAPELLMPPVKLAPWTEMPAATFNTDDEIVPELLMPPETIAPLIKMPFSGALISPSLTTAPSIKLLAMVMPLSNTPPPGAVITPPEWLVTLPVTVMPLMAMQLMLAELSTES